MSGISYWKLERSMSGPKGRSIAHLVKTNARPQEWSKKSILEDFRSHPDTNTLKGAFVAMKTLGFGTEEIKFEVR